MSPGSGMLPVESAPIWPPVQTVSPATVACENPWAGPSSVGLTFRGGFACCTTLVCRARGHLTRRAIDADRAIGSRRHLHAGEPPSKRPMAGAAVHAARAE